MIEQHSFAKKYIESLDQESKKPQFKSLTPFNLEDLSIAGFLKNLKDPSTFFNITPKSWVNNSSSKEISSYVFHNISDNKLYIARGSKPKELSNEEDIEIKILSYYLTFLIDPATFAIPHNKNTTLMKFSKIKSFENKKTFLNIRPYIENLRTLNQYELQIETLREIMIKGSLFGRKVKGLGGILLFSWIINEKFNVKTLSEQLTFVTTDGELRLIDKNLLKAH